MELYQIFDVWDYFTKLQLLLIRVIIINMPILIGTSWRIIRNKWKKFRIWNILFSKSFKVFSAFSIVTRTTHKGRFFEFILYYVILVNRKCIKFVDIILCIYYCRYNTIILHESYNAGSFKTIHPISNVYHMLLFFWFRTIYC